jgi:hypothetical protein
MRRLSDAMRALLCTALLTMLVGCGTVSSLSVDVPSPVTTTFVFSDERPPDEKVSRIEQGAWGRRQFFGDDNVSPTPPDLVKSALMAHLGEPLAGKRVVLTKFVLYAVAPSVSLDAQRLDTATRSVPQPNALGVALAGPAILAIETARSQKAVDVEIRGLVDGVEFIAFSGDVFQGRVTERNVREVAMRALERMVHEVKYTQPAR